MKKCYINSVACISAQNSFDAADFLETIATYDSPLLKAIAPDYKAYISRSAIRRMPKAVKMGVVAAKTALQAADLSQVDAIIVGSGLGCLRNSENFLENILDNDEQYLTPTAFIQSTHNTVAAQIALGMKCKAYNMTYVHGSVSFESSLLDALLLFSEQENHHVLVGGVEELGNHTCKLYQLSEHLKSESANNTQLLESASSGTIFGEGAQFFVLSEQAQTSTYATLQAVEIISQLEEAKVSNHLLAFLENNHLNIADIDAVILGNNGDANYDSYYHNLQEGILQQTPQLYYKHLSGDSYTASAFAFWLAAKILKTQTIPNSIKLNNHHRSAYKNILLYHQYRGENHSFMLLKKFE